MVIKILNLNKCIAAIDAYGRIDYTPEITSATKKVAREARDLAPVYPSPKAWKSFLLGKSKIDWTRQGGTLKGSIRSNIQDKTKSSVTGVVYTMLNYAPYQEFGTRYQEGTPFMIPAMNKHRLGINQSMKKFLRDELKKRSK